ncbi:MAG: helix-turn-helix transcriptional regulator [Phycisphaerales bacterium]|nr:helix-turn-helix transcriptional regulator [Phycisphaerales bacterium]
MTNRIIQSTQRICSLPSIPTQDWASLTAEAIATTSLNTIVGILISRIDPETGLLTTMSSGVSQNSDSQFGNMSAESIHFQDKLDRLKSHGLNLPPHSTSLGLISPISKLNENARNSPLGSIFSSLSFTNPTVMLIPINKEHPDLFLICLCAMNPNHTPEGSSESESDTIVNTLSHFYDIIAEKARIALEHVTNPKVWLTDREHEILDQLILGLSVRQIAENLNRSTHTVHDHVKNLHKKLHASSRGELIAKSLGYQSKMNRCSPTNNPLILREKVSIEELKPIHARKITRQPS